MSIVYIKYIIVIPNISCVCFPTSCRTLTVHLNHNALITRVIKKRQPDNVNKWFFLYPCKVIKLCLQIRIFFIFTFIFRSFPFLKWTLLKFFLARFPFEKKKFFEEKSTRTCNDYLWLFVNVQLIGSAPKPLRCTQRTVFFFTSHRFQSMYMDPQLQKKHL